MPPFNELDWRRLDITAIVQHCGLASAEEPRHAEVLDWLSANGYRVETVDCRGGLAQLLPQFNRLFHWEQNFGYELSPDRRNLNAVRDGFHFDVPPDGGVVLELVRPDVVWREDTYWLLKLLAIAQEHSLRQLALGRRFFTLLVLPPQCPLVGEVVEETRVPSPTWVRAGLSLSRYSGRGQG